MSSITYHFKVDNPKLDNEVIQMKSDHLQPPVYRGTVGYYLGAKRYDDGRYKSSKIKVANLR